MRTMVLLAAVALGVVGCDGGTPPEESMQAVEPVAEQAPERSVGQADERPAGAPREGPRPVWALTVEGKAELSGPMVMATRLIGVTTYTLLGADAGTVINLADGQTDAYMVQLTFPQTKEMCVYRADNRQQSAGLAVTRAGDRFEVDGAITCSPVGQADAVKSVHRINGYFEKQ